MADQVMSEAIAKAVAEAIRIAIQTMAVKQTQRTANTPGPKLGGPELKQPNFNWEAADKYTEWKVFILEVRNVLSTYNAQEQDKIAMVKKWQGRKGLHYIESLTEGEKEACNSLQGLFHISVTKFRLQFNDTIKSLQFRKLYRFEGKSAKEWMGRLPVAVAECNYKEIDWQLKEQFIHQLNDKVMLDEVISELTAKSNDKQMTSEGVLVWAKRVEAQRAQAAILNDITESHQFDRIKMAQKPKSSQDRQTTNTTSHKQLCRYCGGIHLSWQVPSIWKDVHQMQEDVSLEESVQEQEGLHHAWSRNWDGAGIPGRRDRNSEYWFCTFKQKLLRHRGHKHPYWMISQNHTNLTELKWLKNQKAAKIDRQQTQHLTNSCAGTVVGSTCPDSAKHMKRCAPDAGRCVTWRKCAGARGTAPCMK